MTTSTIFMTATDARYNPIRDRVIHEEARKIESVILEAVRTGYFNATISDNTPMTQSTPESAIVSSVNSVTGVFTVNNHPFRQGDCVQVMSTNTLPSPVLSTSFYYVIYIDANNIKLAATFQEALNGRPTPITITNGVSAVTMVDSGSGYIMPPNVSLTGGNPTTNATAMAYLADYGSISDIAVLSNGDGFTDVPNVTIVSQGSGAVAGAVTYQVVNVNVLTQGSNYRVGDSLLINSGTGVQAVVSVTQINNGAVTSVAISNPGNYSVLPTLSGAATTASPGGGSGCTLNLSMGINSIALQAGGAQYVAAPLVLISGGGGTGATATATVIAGAVTAINVTNPGSNFTSAPTIVFNNGENAQAIAILQPAQVGNIVLTNNGGNTYTSIPNVYINAAGSGATAGQIYMRVSAVSLANNGVGYSVNDVLLVAGGAGTSGASIQVTTIGSLGEIVGYVLITGGLYTQIPVLSNNSVLGGTGSAATFNLTLCIDSVTVGSSGSDYTTPPTVTVVSDSGSNAVIKSSLINGNVSALTVTSNGSNFASIPNVTISSGSGATAQAYLNNTGVAEIIVTNPGANYTYALVTIDGNGTGATANAIISNSTIQSINVITSGNNYSYQPNVTISGDGTGATATSYLQPTNINFVEVTNPGNDYTGAPLVTINGSATAVAYLTATGVDRIDVLQGGDKYTSPPIVSVIPAGNQQGNVTSPSTSASIGYSVDHIQVTNTGVAYQSTPNVIISSPQDTNGNLALATASIGVGQGSLVINGYLPSIDYYAAWKGNVLSDPNLNNPYNDRMNTVIAYFTSMGYTINRQTNPATNNTLMWVINW